MAFLDSMKQKATSVGQNISSSVKTGSEDLRLKGEIAKADSKIRELKERLGAQYYAAHKDDPEEAFAETVAEIIAVENEKEDYAAQLNTLRGVRTCTECGSGIAKGAKFCSHCGAPAPAEPEPAAPASSALKHCQNCGAAMPQDVIFCTACGTKLEDSQPAEAEAVEAADAVPASFSYVPAAPVGGDASEETAEEPASGEEVPAENASAEE